MTQATLSGTGSGITSHTRGLDYERTTKGSEQMDAYWTNCVNEVLGLLGGDQAHRQRILSGDLASIRVALKGSRFETMEEREFAAVVAATRTTLRRPNAKA
jgi:hypothetical protein